MHAATQHASADTGFFGSHPAGEQEGLGWPRAFFQDRSLWFWAVLGIVAVVQIVALWVVCSQQVQQARSRQAAAHVQHVALYECLQSTRGAAMAGCRGRTVASSAGGTQPLNAIASGTMAVIYQR